MVQNLFYVDSYRRGEITITSVVNFNSSKLFLVTQSLTMKKLFLSLTILVLLGANGQGQQLISPTSNSIEKNRIKNGKYLMGYYMLSEGKYVEIAHFNIDILYNSQALTIATALRFLNSGEIWNDTSIADPGNFKAVYRSSSNKKRDYSIKFGQEVIGTYFDKETNKRVPIIEKVKNNFFDSYAYPYLLGLLPLTIGYRAELPVYEYLAAGKSNVKKARIEEVKNNIYKSDLTGEHKVWQVSVIEESTNDQYQYFIDKETRRIWKIEISSNGQSILLLDKEIDFNPYKTRFDKEATMKMIKGGSSVISGQAFARDNQAGIKGIAILNVNKKQPAPKGTSIVLIPYTDFFKEWVEINKSSRKKGVAIPLPQDVLDCIKTTTVYDEEGNFDFVNLKPGEYLIFTEFAYVHTATHTEVVGYTDTYINGMFQGSTARTQSYQYDTNASASVQKIVTIKKDGEKINIKLKKTL